MSLQTLKINELKTVAEEYGVNISEAKNKAEILAILAEEGVTDELLDNLAKVEKEEIEPLRPYVSKTETVGEMTFVKMERDNRSYEAGGYEFTRENPFVSMPMSIAIDIFQNEKGFRLATPEEVKEYYS